MDNFDFKNKKVAILGIGTEGLALAEFLSGKCDNLSILDSLNEKEILNRLTGEELKQFQNILADKKITKVFGDDYLNNLNNHDIIFRSPGISYLSPKIQEAKKAGVEISSQIKLFFDLCPCPIIGVTGTKGKGTTSSLISEILKKNLQFTIYNLQSTSGDQINEKWKLKNDELPQVYLAGNIGYPAITLISKLKKYDFVILELSSFQLMDLEKSPHIAVVTNLTVDHLNYHKDIAEYQNSKLNILKYQTENDLAILNKQSTFADENLKKLKSQIKYFSTDENGVAIVKKINDSYKVILKEEKEIEICSLENIQLFGLHNLQNIAAATLVARTLNVEPKIISEVVKDFRGLPHRIEKVAEINNILFINDSFATNPDPAMAAIDSFSQDKILILGGSSKGADFSELAKKIAFSNVRSVILIGEEELKIKAALEKEKFSGQVVSGGENMAEIVNRALNLAWEGDVVLLSPACASFGMFKNYKDRGEKFKTAVLKLQI